MQKIRCAIYTRKSSEEGLEQAFNSLDAQREACAAFVASQKAEGWVLVPETYDDGGLSEGTLERPGLQRLLWDITEGRVDRIVVYKIDRLTRSLSDFAKIVDRLDAAEASFVSVTQSFNTATSMGRLTLNMLLSFAQFEREVTAERIRDKIAASKRKGLWMGGQVPMGYDNEGRTLKIREDEAQTIRLIYDLYREHQILRKVVDETAKRGLRTRVRTRANGDQTGGTMFERGHVHHILTKPIYAGRIRHKREVFEGQHPAVIAPEIWDEVQRMLSDEAARPRGPVPKGRASRSQLAGKVYDEKGDRLTPSHTKTRAGQRLRYYVSHRLIAKGGDAGVSGWRLPGPELEATVARAVQAHLANAETMQSVAYLSIPPEALGATQSKMTWIAAHPETEAILKLVARIDIAPGEMEIVLHQEAVSEQIGLPADDLPDALLTFKAAFTARKRGVETKLILANVANPVDQTLLTNVAKAHHWFSLLQQGQSFQQIAEATGTSKRRIQQMIDLAFLAPDIVKAITEGRQSTGLTSEWLKRRTLPADWDAQRKLIETL